MGASASLGAADRAATTSRRLGVAFLGVIVAFSGLVIGAPVAGATGTVAGTALRQADSQPMPAGTVEVIACANTNPAPTCPTKVTAPVDASGSYALELSDGTWGIAPFLVNRTQSFGQQAINLALNPVVPYLLVNVSGSAVDVVSGTGTNFQLTAGVVRGSVLRPGSVAPSPGSVVVQACSFSWTTLCGGPTADVAADGTYSLILTGGQWSVAPRSTSAVPVGLGSPVTETVAGNEQTQDFSVQFATVSGTLAHPNAAPYPAGYAGVSLCPSSPPSSPSCTGPRTAVNADGSWSMSVPPGTWYVIGFASAAPVGPNVSLALSASGNVVSNTVSLGALSDGGSANATLVVASARVSGTVRDQATNAPLADATVGLCLNSCGNPNRQSRSAADGTYALLASPGTWQPVATLSAGFGATDLQSPLSVIDGDDRTVDFHIGGGSISGVVLAPGGAPAANVSVRACNSSARCGPSPGVSSGPGGSFTIAHLAPGTYDIVAEPNGGPSQPWGFARVADVSVAEGANASGNVLQLVDGHTLQVTVKDATTHSTITGFTGQVFVYADGMGRLGPGGHYTRSPAFGSGGVYSVGALPAGSSYTVLVTPNGSSYGQAYVSPVVVDAGTPSTAIDVVLTAPATLTGTVRDGVTSAPIVGAPVVVCPGSQLVPTATPSSQGFICIGPKAAFANASGVYTITGLGATPYRVRAYRSSTLGSEGSALGQPVLSVGSNTFDIPIGGDDGDGVIEVPGYDGNGDGPDANQMEVTSVPAATGAGVVTIDSIDPSYPLSDVTTSVVPSTPAPPSNAEFPYGIIGFTVNLPTGQTAAAVDLYLSGPGPVPNRYYKLQHGAYVDITPSVSFHSGENRVTLHLVDGGLGDEDGSVNGKIVDPILPGYVAITDADPPSITIAAPADGAVYTLGQTALADYGCDDGPDGTGVVACAGTVAPGQPIDTSGVGSKTFTVHTSDRASNVKDVSVTYSVVYPFTGFLSPVNSVPTLNSVKAGAAVPVKFRLGGDRGLGVLAAGSPWWTKIACDSSAPVDAIEQTVTAGGSSLSYDSQTDTYSYVWKTGKDWSDTCRQLVLKLDDGTAHIASFKFK